MATRVGPLFGLRALPVEEGTGLRFSQAARNTLENGIPAGCGSPSGRLAAEEIILRHRSSSAP